MVSCDDLLAGFKKIGLQKGDVVLVHSSFKSFGGVEGGPETVIKALRKVLGNEGTLVVPTYTFEFCDGFNKTGQGIFDVENSPSEMGIITEMVRKMPGAKRSVNPIYSMAAIGKKAAEITSADKDKNVFGEKSIFDKLHKINAKIMIIGLNYNRAMTFFHYIEHITNCDYRFPKQFSGLIKNGKETREDTYTLDVRRENIITDVDAMGEVLEQNGIVKKTMIGESEIKLMNAKDVYRVTIPAMKENPELLYSKVKEAEEDAGAEMMKLMKELYPICRSITGNGVRETLQILSQHIPLKIHEVPTGTKVFDWTVPKEWNIRDAWVKDPNGKKIIDFKKSNLHVLNYSSPIKGKMDLATLKEHLFTLPDQPKLIPYFSSYYKENWGFCLSHNQLKKLEKGQYEVFIDADFSQGSLTYGEYLFRGESTDEVLLSCYICHPSLCNDNLSGPVLLAQLAKNLPTISLKKSYHFLFIPETIGAIAWLVNNEKKLDRIKAGLVATCLGDKGTMTYQKSRQGDAWIDRAVTKVMLDSGKKFDILDYEPTGSDERQFCSPGFNLPVGSLMRTMYGKFPEYHTSADNLNFVDKKSLQDSLNKYLDVIFILENDGVYLNQNPKCEPQLGKRGLYNSIGSRKNMAEIQTSIFWILNMSDGTNSLIDIATRSGINFKSIKIASDALEEKGLLKRVDSGNNAKRTSKTAKKR